MARFKTLTSGAKYLSKVFGGILMLSLMANLTWAVNIEGVRLWRAPDKTRLVFDLSAPVEHKLFSLSKPNRIVIDFDKGKNKFDLKQLELDSTPISQIRSGKRGKSGLRIVLDLKSSAKPRSFLLKKHGDKPNRLVLDLHDSAKKVVKTIPRATVKTVSKRDIVIAVDAGHGGEDPGATGPNKLREKHVVLAIAKELAQQINATKGYKAKLTRTSDYYIPLRKRRNLARDMRADLFISIHADAFKDKRAYGASVFALSSRGASSETARFLAQKENEADLIGGVGGVSLDDKDKVLAGVLLDLSMAATMSTSRQVGEKVLTAIGKVARLHKPQVENAGFLVLKSPDVPSILVETGFISNPTEAKNLNSRRFRKKMASQIFSGVKSYFNSQPPVGSYLAWKKSSGGKRVYITARGDTLAKIASNHQVTVPAIKKANGLRSTRIQVGQRLVIPSS